MARPRRDRRRITRAQLHNPGGRADSAAQADLSRDTAGPLRSFIDGGSSQGARKATLYVVGGAILAVYASLAGALGWVVGLGFSWPATLALVAIYAYGCGHVRGARGG